MFMTFKASKEPCAQNVRTEAIRSTTPNTSKRKRTTVLRACERCRRNRVKCDNGRPCENCRLRRQPCSREPSSDPREIEQLRSRIAELEEQFQRTPESLEASHSTTSEYSSPSWSWPDAWVDDPQNPGESPRYFGPTSFVYFSSRVCQNLDKLFHRAKLGTDLKSFTINETSGVLSEENDQIENLPSRRQEEFLLGLFWQSYHFVFPVVDEADFCSHYDSLWGSLDYDNPESLEPETTRAPSALADIAVALCIQHTASMMADDGPSQSVYSSRDGDWLFYRCQRALSSPQTRPSLYTLQCIIYSIVYLVNSSCLELAHRSLANAVHTAYSLGLHHNSPGDVSLESFRNTRNQVWWALYCFDSLLSFKLGHPCMINPANITVNEPELLIPGHTETITNKPGEFSKPWYFSQYLKLTCKMRSVSADVLQTCAHLMSQHGSTLPIHDEPSVRQRCSAHLKDAIKPLHAWAQEVPSFLRLKRQGDGESFSTANARLDIDHYLPLWVQRQRVLLELSYHNAMHSLFRLFMKIPHNPPSISPGIGATFPTTSDRNDVHALDHAVTSIRIIDQVLSQSDILNSWHDAYHYAWDAALTIFAYTLVHPLCPYTFAARNAIDTAKGIFDAFFQHGFPTAAEASRITVELKEVVYSHSRSFKTGPKPSGFLSLGTRVESPCFNVDIFKTGLDEWLAPILDFEVGRPTSEMNVFEGSSALQINDIGLDPVLDPLGDFDFI